MEVNDANQRWKSTRRSRFKSSMWIPCPRLRGYKQVGKSMASDSVPNNFINTSSCFSNPRDCHQRQYLGIADNTLEHSCFYVATLNKTQALRSNSAEQLDQHRPVHGAESHQTSVCHPLSHPQSSPHQSHPQSESHRLKHQWKPSATIAKLRSAYTKLPPP